MMGDFMELKILTRGALVPQLLLPGPDVDARRWATVACDQYTSQPEYWQTVLDEVGSAPSTLRMMLPEAWLGTEREAAWSSAIPKAMLEAQKSLLPVNAPIYLERSWGKTVRRGLMLALDLEEYDYTPGARSLIRPTEKTVPERLPPRIKIRAEASLEMPHAMMLMDDREDRVMECLDAVKSSAPCYDTELMARGGHLTGWAVPQTLWDALASALDGLKSGPDPLLFAVGDGNHSLAAAKAYWGELKKSLSVRAQQSHPARFFLAEIVNLYDEGLNFEPIHRLITPTDPENLWQRLQALAGDGPEVTVLMQGQERSLCLAAERNSLPLAFLQPALDALLLPEEKQDFIHGDNALRTLSQAPNALGIWIPPLDKAALFPTVKAAGVLPRKSFSMGEAHQKRYYFECRRIKENEWESRL